MGFILDNILESLETFFSLLYQMGSILGNIIKT